jgi:hypothetical protein
MRWLRRSLVQALAVSITATGCASHEPIEWVVHPAKPLPRAPQVIADATPVDLSGFHLLDHEYDRYARARDARVQHAVSDAGVSGGGGLGGGGGNPVLLIIALPIFLITLIAVNAASKGKAHSKASDRDHLLEREDTARLSPVLTKTATGAALAERTGRVLNPDQGETSGRLRVSVKSIEQRLYFDGRVALAVRAEAQAMAQDGAMSPPSQHFALIPPKDNYSYFGWTESAVQDDLKRALDTLAVSIASTYRPGAIAPPSQRYALQGDARAVKYTSGLREFIRDYDAR